MWTLEVGCVSTYNGEMSGLTNEDAQFHEAFVDPNWKHRKVYDQSCSNGKAYSMDPVFRLGFPPSRRMYIRHLPFCGELSSASRARFAECSDVSSVARQFLGDKCCSPLRSVSVGSVHQCPDIPGSKNQFLFLFLLFCSTAVGWVRQPR